MYRVAPYFFTKTAIELPVMIITPILTVVITYFGIGCTITVKQFFIQLAAYILVQLSASSFGYFLSSIFSQEETAVQMSSVFLMPMILFSGFFSNSGKFPDWIGWLQYVSPMRYSLEIVVDNEFSSRNYGPHDVHLTSFLGFNLGLPLCFGILILLTVVLRILSLVCLKLLIGKF